MITTADDPLGVAAYYESIAPFYEAEMAVRYDVGEWLALAERTGARTSLDLGCGGGRIARRLASRIRTVGVDLLTALLPRERGFDFVQADMRALPFAARRFDLAVAANDPFAHLLTDGDRTRAVGEATRVADRLVVDGLALTDADQTEARSGGHIREATLPDGTQRHETWLALGGHRYRTTYRYLRDGKLVRQATTDVRAWSLDEPALLGRQLSVAGGLDGRAYRSEAPRFVLVIGEPL